MDRNNPQRISVICLLLLVKQKMSHVYESCLMCMKKSVGMINFKGKKSSRVPVQINLDVL
jgi:hypothetical protein